MAPNIIAEYLANVGFKVDKPSFEFSLKALGKLNNAFTGLISTLTTLYASAVGFGVAMGKADLGAQKLGLSLYTTTQNARGLKQTMDAMGLKSLDDLKYVNLIPEQRKQFLDLRATASATAPGAGQLQGLADFRKIGYQFEKFGLLLSSFFTKLGGSLAKSLHIDELNDKLGSLNTDFMGSMDQVIGLIIKGVNLFEPLIKMLVRGIPLIIHTIELVAQVLGFMAHSVMAIAKKFGLGDALSSVSKGAGSGALVGGLYGAGQGAALGFATGGPAGIIPGAVIGGARGAIVGGLAGGTIGAGVATIKGGSKKYRQMYEAYADAAAKKYGIAANVLKNLITQESGWNPNARSGAGAIGIAQFMSGTAKGMGVDPHNPLSAIDGAARLLSGNIKRYGSVAYGVAAYNGGGGSVNYFKKRGGIFYDPHAPANSWANQTGGYVQQILGSGAVSRLHTLYGNQQMAKGGRSHGPTNITINVNGAHSPQHTAGAVKTELTGMFLQRDLGTGYG